MILHLFLSRLCGGEATIVPCSLRLAFLSRLCGGEDNPNGWARYANFLSRLCGGEVLRVFCLFAFKFLSRLCGGEGYLFAAINWVNFSKPPMWR